MSTLINSKVVEELRLINNEEVEELCLVSSEEVEELCLISSEEVEELRQCLGCPTSVCTMCERWSRRSNTEP